MDLYEYQARQLLEEQDIPTPDAIFAQNSHEVAEAADKIGYPCVIKAQVKIGHRGQAGGVKIAHNRDEAILESESILPMTIHGHKVSGVLVAEARTSCTNTTCPSPWTAPRATSTCWPPLTAAPKSRKSPRNIRSRQAPAHRCAR